MIIWRSHIITQLGIIFLMSDLLMQGTVHLVDLQNVMLNLLIMTFQLSNLDINYFYTFYASFKALVNYYYGQPNVLYIHN